MIGLRHLTMDDAGAVGRIRSGASMRFIPARQPRPESALEWLTRVLSYADVVPHACWYWGITSGDDLVGLTSIRRYPHGEGCLSYILREDCWERGYGTDAVREMVAFAFSVVGLDTLTAKHHPDNPASGRVLIKAGFTCRGVEHGYLSYAKDCANG
ncbi:GNAT family N-acetyltransferase [Streptomyces spiramyceticus]|uniref:GNAT family N-acetyltransferase n=1 Tax=Streptomyces spiramyceticus TaxID=299717 RepID=UPI00237B112A|nr:GNAT family N-acetyltransferase [Streptomyces spiramyceticus]